LQAVWTEGNKLPNCYWDAVNKNGTEQPKSSDKVIEKLRKKEEKIMKKRVLATILASVLALGVFAGCGGSNAASGDDKVITVGASSTPHAEILEQVKPILAEQGYTLEITIFDDYVIPNQVVESGEMDANYFQHVLYLGNFNDNNDTHLVNAGGIHYEPLGIYPGQKASLADIAEGDVIAVPNDPTNEARALLLLQENGLLTLKEGAGIEATISDIVENPYNITFQELAAEQVARVKEEVAFIVLNGNYALQAGLSADKDAIACENANSEAIQNYVNVIAVKEGNENNADIKALIEVLKSDEIKEYILNTYNGSVIPFE